MFHLERNLVIFFSLKILNSSFFKRSFLGVFLGHFFFLCFHIDFLLIMRYLLMESSVYTEKKKKKCNPFVFHSFSYFNIHRYLIYKIHLVILIYTDILYIKFNSLYWRVYSCIQIITRYKLNNSWTYRFHKDYFSGESMWSYLKSISDWLVGFNGISNPCRVFNATFC